MEGKRARPTDYYIRANISAKGGTLEGSIKQDTVGEIRVVGSWNWLRYKSLGEASNLKIDEDLVDSLRSLIFAIGKTLLPYDTDFTMLMRRVYEVDLLMTQDLSFVGPCIGFESIGLETQWTRAKIPVTNNDPNSWIFALPDGLFFVKIMPFLHYNVVGAFWGASRKTREYMRKYKVWEKIFARDFPTFYDPNLFKLLDDAHVQFINELSKSPQERIGGEPREYWKLLYELQVSRQFPVEIIPSVLNLNARHNNPGYKHGQMLLTVYQSKIWALFPYVGVLYECNPLGFIGPIQTFTSATSPGFKTLFQTCQEMLLERENQPARILFDVNAIYVSLIFGRDGGISKMICLNRSTGELFEKQTLSGKDGRLSFDSRAIIFPEGSIEIGNALKISVSRENSFVLRDKDDPKRLIWYREIEPHGKAFQRLEIITPEAPEVSQCVCNESFVILFRNKKLTCFSVNSLEKPFYELTYVATFENAWLELNGRFLYFAYSKGMYKHSTLECMNLETKKTVFRWSAAIFSKRIWMTFLGPVISTDEGYILITTRRDTKLLGAQMTCFVCTKSAIQQCSGCGVPVCSADHQQCEC